MKNKYPIIFVHGMFGWGADEGINSKAPYWGGTTGDLVEFLHENDVESYAASVGPVSSAWDRACELYARLTGTRVDYGVAHSNKNKHRRFGRTYTEPLFEGWCSEKKIHLVGHSFGGNSVRVFAYLLTYGSAEERAATKPEELSPLFEGGHEDLLHTVITLCSPHNGTTAFATAEKFKLIPIMEQVVYNYIGVAGRTKFSGKQVDFHMEQYGLSDTPGEKDAYPISRAIKKIRKGKDSIAYDMSPEGASSFNGEIKISPNLYYFSYAFNAVQKNKRGLFVPKDTDFPVLTATSTLILFYNLISKSSKEFNHVANDGLVNIESALHPANEPFTDYDENNINKGIWNVMPVRKGDHGTAIGLLADKKETRDFYLEIIDIILKTEALDEKEAVEADR